MPDNYLAFGKPDFGELEIDEVTRVLRSGWVGMGPETLQFETELSAYFNIPNVVTVNSCTSALFLSLFTLGIKEGDEVICPSLTWCATANAVLYVGAKVVFCDVDSNSLCVTPQTVLPCITNKTRAVIAVHYGGYAVDVDALREVLPDNVHIIEDAAHALGAKYENGKMVGASGNLTCFSFYANKNLSTGEGGAISLANNQMADHIRRLRQNGMPVNAWNRFSRPDGLLVNQVEELGYKMNYTDLQASIGRIQLRRQLEFAVKRLAIAKIYYEAMIDFCFPCQSRCIDPNHARHLFVILTSDENPEITRDNLILELRKKNIGASIHYYPLHLMPFYSGSARSPLPVTEDIYPRIMTLPISASMSTEDAYLVVDALKNLLQD